eukprot:GEMP01003847.1.p1 GENE.GEMP01003847.1~~GEMP01003847.1.p1  ORF type:complete len:810 (+),score=152.63 GEMP01003847.1:214-2643(+)
MKGGGGPAYQGLLEQVALNQFGDILRVGKLAINASHIEWDCHGLAKEDQLKNFQRAFLETLEATDGLLCWKTSEYINLLPEEKEVLWFWVMKATSINYALFEVMMTLHSLLETDDPCQVVTVETYHPKSGEQRMKYGLTTYLDRVEVRLIWTKAADNIFLVNPMHATRVHSGFLSQVSTSFPLPLEPVIRPTYYVTARIRENPRKDAKRNFLHRIASKCCLKSQCDLFHPLRISQNLSHLEHLPHLRSALDHSVHSKSGSIEETVSNHRQRALIAATRTRGTSINSPVRQVANGTQEDADDSEPRPSSLLVPAEGFAAPIPASTSIQGSRQNQWHITWKPPFRREGSIRRTETTLPPILIDMRKSMQRCSESETPRSSHQAHPRDNAPHPMVQVISPTSEGDGPTTGQRLPTFAGMPTRAVSLSTVTEASLDSGDVTAQLSSYPGSRRKARDPHYVNLFAHPTPKKTRFQKLHKFATSPSLVRPFMTKKLDRSYTSPRVTYAIPSSVSDVTWNSSASEGSSPSASFRGGSPQRGPKLKGSLKSTRKLTALAYYDATASAGDPVGMFVLGQMCYHDVLGDASIPNRLEKAKWYFERAMELGHIDAIPWLKKVERRIEHDTSVARGSTIAGSEHAGAASAGSGSREFLSGEEERMGIGSIVPWLKRHSDNGLTKHPSSSVDVPQCIKQQSKEHGIRPSAPPDDDDDDNFDGPETPLPSVHPVRPSNVTKNPFTGQRDLPEADVEGEPRLTVDADRNMPIRVEFKPPERDRNSSTGSDEGSFDHPPISILADSLQDVAVADKHRMQAVTTAL